MTSSTHVPVLLEPVLEGLGIREDGLYVDGTFGRGGHSRAILGRLGESGRLIAIDRDPAAIASAPERLTSDPRFELVRGEIAHLERIIAARNMAGRVDGILLDLGVSSPQLDEAERGFSFLRDGPLDMRMDPDSGESASEWLCSTTRRAATAPATCGETSACHGWTCRCRPRQKMQRNNHEKQIPTDSPCLWDLAQRCQ